MCNVNACMPMTDICVHVSSRLLRWKSDSTSWRGTNKTLLV